MRVLVTRPEPDAERTAALLRARGCEVMLAPLLRLETIAAPLNDGPWHALVLTSVNAVRAIAAHPQLPSLLDIPAYAVGGRTADAAFALGFENVLSAEGDVKDLARVIRTHLRSDARLLHLAGVDRSGDLAGDLAISGINLSTAVIYRAAAGELAAEARAALLAGQIDGVLHFSRRSAQIYLDRAADILAQALAPLHYCLSRQVADPLAAAGAAQVRIASRPTEADLVDLVLGCLAKGFVRR
jgi:uroporphyrinogen-III synthase